MKYNVVSNCLNLEDDASRCKNQTSFPGSQVRVEHNRVLEPWLLNDQRIGVLTADLMSKLRDEGERLTFMLSKANRDEFGKSLIQQVFVFGVLCFVFGMKYMIYLGRL